MDDLEIAYRKWKTLSFPSMPDDDGLATVVSSLSEMDGLFSSLAARAGRGERILPSDVPVIHGFVNRLMDISNLPERDADIYAATVAYLDALADLRDALLRA